MRSRLKRPLTKEELEAWQPWFAWRPVKAQVFGCTYQWAWLEYVQRKRRYFEEGRRSFLNRMPTPTEYRILEA